MLRWRRHAAAAAGARDAHARRMTHVAAPQVGSPARRPAASARAHGSAGEAGSPAAGSGTPARDGLLARRGPRVLHAAPQAAPAAGAKLYTAVLQGGAAGRRHPPPCAACRLHTVAAARRSRCCRAVRAPPPPRVAPHTTQPESGHPPAPPPPHTLNRRTPAGRRAPPCQAAPSPWAPACGAPLSTLRCSRAARPRCHSCCTTRRRAVTRRCPSTSRVGGAGGAPSAQPA